MHLLLFLWVGLTFSFSVPSFSGFFSGRAFAALSQTSDVFLLPRTCNELIPDSEPFVRFFESVARGQVRRDTNFSKRLFTVLSLRQQLEDSTHLGRKDNPIDLLIQKTLCYFRTQTEPVQPVPYDHEPLLKFLKGSLAELEKKIEGAIYDVELAEAKRESYEDQLAKNRDVVDRLRNSAFQEADKAYQKIQKKAKTQAGKK